ncbi:AraC family transcriptional regulator [Micromonospora chersina]|uniref:AraC family transcriptional regulator n=1 Tax=Micromonospora chersina TaxID=47854 RepID=UPI0033EB0824
MDNDKSTEEAVRRAIDKMHSNLGEALTIDDMARAAMFSKFHFSRIFRRITGISPGRFLSAARLQEAKNLLLSTSLNVADISLRVGYSSVGTFSSRFSRSVGMSPTVYRRHHGYSTHIPVHPRGSQAKTSATVEARIVSSSEEAPGPVFVGLFPDPLPEGRPLRCAVLNEPGPFVLQDVPEGTWYLLAQAGFAQTHGPSAAASTAGRQLLVASRGPLVCGRGAIVRADELHLKPSRVFDPPVLLALLEIRRNALEQLQYESRAA